MEEGVWRQNPEDDKGKLENLGRSKCKECEFMKAIWEEIRKVKTV